MPEYQQIHQSKKSDTIFQKQAAPTKQIPLSNQMVIIQRAKINPKSLTHADVMQLQRTIGNRAVAQLLSGIVNSSTAHEAPIHRSEITEEEEPLQSKMADTIQRQEPEEEELIQGKMIETIQRQEPEEEELIQGKFETLQRQPEDEEDLMQGKFASGLTGTLQAKEEAPPNKTGMPDHLKSGIENISGMDLSDVRVHYNSSKPKQLNALAYAQGSDIHIAPGQERHLPHEAWHVVQQKQGRVEPTMQMKGKVNINDDPCLEKEADVIGWKAVQMKNANPSSEANAHKNYLRNNPVQVIQRVTQVEYFAPQNFAYTNPPIAGGALNTNNNVGNGIQADLDLTDPIRGSGVGGGAIPANLMADLALNFPGVPGGWVQGHLLNSKLGGVGITSNLFPITTEANGKHSSVEREIKELLYNQPPMGVFNLANRGYVQYTVNANPVAGINNGTTQAPDVDFNITYRTQQNQAPGPAGPPLWNPAKNITITSRAAGRTPVPAAWTPFGAGMGMPIGGGGVINVAMWAVNILTNPLNPNHLPMLGALGLVAAPAVPGGANLFLTQQAPAGGPNLKIIGWQF